MTSMQILRALLEITVYSAVLFACIMVFKAIARGKLSPTLNFVLWFLLIIRLCVPVTIESAYHLFALPPEQIQTSTATESYASGAMPRGISLPQIGSSSLYMPEQQEAMQPTGATQSPGATPQAPPLTVYGWLVIAWLGGILAFGFRTAFLSLRITKVIKYKSVPAPAEIERIYESCRDEMGIKKRPSLLVTQHLFSPALVVSARPTILLPYEFVKNAPPQQIRFALCHELAHYKRRDHWLCILLRVLSTVYWFNPLIWLAEKEIAADMETACDNSIVRGMQKKEKAYYANTILSMFSARAQTPFVLGLALPNTRRVAEKRIRGIYMKNKTQKSVKFAAFLLTAALFAACFTTACQPTTASPIASNTVQAVPANASAAPIIQQDRQPSTTADSKYRETKKLSDIVSVEYDAEVVQPEKIPVASMQIRDFTEEDLQKVVDYFFAGRPAYTPWPCTKADIQKEIELYQQANNNFIAVREKYIAEHSWAAGLYQSMLDNGGGLTAETWDTAANQYSLTHADHAAFISACGSIASIEQNNSLIKKSQEELKTAPDAAEKKPAEIKFNNIAIETDPAGTDTQQTTPPYPPVSQCNVWSEKPDGTISQVYGEKRDGGQSSMITYDRKIINGTYIHWIPAEKPVSISTDQAQKLAEQAVAAVCPDLVLEASTINELYGWYVFSFTRRVAEVPIVYDSYAGYAYAYQSGDEPKVSSYEAIQVRVNDDGIEHLEWRAPYTGIQITGSGAKVIPLSEAQAKFESNIMSALMERKYADPDSKDDKMDSIILDINRIELGLTRIQDNAGNFTLIPTWDFYGEATAIRNGQEETFNRFGQSQGNDSLGTVNALDGSELKRSGLMQNW